MLCTRFVLLLLTVHVTYFQVIAILLEESKEEETGSKGQNQTHINVSEGYTQLDILPILQGKYFEFGPVSETIF